MLGVKILFKSVLLALQFATLQPRNDKRVLICYERCNSVLSQGLLPLFSRFVAAHVSQRLPISIHKIARRRMLRKVAASVFLYRNAESAGDAPTYMYIYSCGGAGCARAFPSQVGQSKKRYGSEFPFSRDWLRLHSPPQLAAAQTTISTIGRKSIIKR